MTVTTFGEKIVIHLFWLPKNKMPLENIFSLSYSFTLSDSYENPSLYAR